MVHYNLNDSPWSLINSGTTLNWDDNVTIGGDLSVSGDFTFGDVTADELKIDGHLLIDTDNAEAFLARKDGDAGDCVTINTISNQLLVRGDTNDGTTKPLIVNDSDNAEMFSIDSNGTLFAVGLGASSVILAADGTAAAPSISWASDTDTGFYRAGDNKIGISTGGAARAYFDATGQFGLRTDNPQALFHFLIGGAVGDLPTIFAGTSQIIQNTTDAYSNTRVAYCAGNNGEVIIDLGDTDDIDAGRIKYNHTDNYLAFGTSGKYQLWLSADGHLGVGEDTPTSRTHIKGELGVALTNTCTSSGAGNRDIASTAHGLTQGAAVRLPSGAAAALEIFTVATVTDTDNFVVDSDLSNAITATAGYGDTSLLNITTGDNASKLYIDNSGKIGVNNDSPFTNFHLKHTIASEAPFIQNETDDARFFIGSVGGPSGNIGELRWDYTNNVFKFVTTVGGSEKPNNLVLDAGKVGIGTASPDTQLHTTGGRSVNVTTVNEATYDLLITDDILNVTYAATGAVTSLTLPTAQTTAGRRITIKDAGGNAGTNNITIDTEGAQTIDGSATAVLAGDYDSINLYCDGSNWFIY